MRLGCLIFVATIALLVYGGQGVYEGISSRHLQVVTYEEFARNKPNHGWFKITNCFLDVLDAAYEKNKEGGPIVRAFVPVHGVDDPEETKNQLLLATKDPEILSTMEELARLDNGTEAEAKAHVEKNAEKLLSRRICRACCCSE